MHPLLWVVAALFVVYFAIDPIKQVLGVNSPRRVARGGQFQRGRPPAPGGRSTSPGRSRPRGPAGWGRPSRSRHPRRRPCVATVAEVDHGADQGAQDRVVADAVDDAAVELDDVGSGEHDVPQRREAGAHVVDRQAQSLLAQRSERGREGGVVVDPVVLGELEKDPVQGEPAEQLGALGCQEGRGGDVHGDVAGDRARCAAARSRASTSRSSPRPMLCASAKQTSGAFPHAAGTGSAPRRRRGGRWPGRRSAAGRRAGRRAPITGVRRSDL